MGERKKARGGIERKYLTSILWVGVTPLVLGLAGYLVARQAQHLAIRQTLSTAAQETAEGFDLAMRNRLRLTEQTARSPYLLAALTGEADARAASLTQAGQFLSHLARYSGELDSVYSLYDSGGACLYSTSSNPADAIPRPEWTREPQKARFSSFAYFLDEQRYAASVVAPVLDPRSDTTVGYLRERQGMGELLRFVFANRPLHGEDRGPETFREVVYVSGDERYTVYGTADNHEGFTPVYDSLDPRLAQRIAEDPDRDFDVLALNDYGSQGRAVSAMLAYHRLLPGSGLFILVYRPTSDIYAKVDLIALMIILGSVLVIGFFCIIAYRFANNNIIRPVSLLNEGAQIIRQGDLELKLRIDTGDEIEELAHSFNRMATALRLNISQLEESEEKYRSVINSMRDGIYQTDPDGKIALINPAGAEILGFSNVAEAIGTPLRRLFVDGPEFRQFSRELEESRFVERFRLWMKTPRRKTIYVEISANRVYDDRNRYIGMEGTFRDVTQNMRLERAARERSERIAVINQIANAINSSLEAGRVYESTVVEVHKLITFDYASVALFHDGSEDFELRQLWPEPAPGQPVLPAKDAGGQSCVAWVQREKNCLLVRDLAGDGIIFAGQFPADIRSCLCAPLYAAGGIIGTLNLGSRKPEGFGNHEVDVIEQLTPHVAVAIRNAELLRNLQASLEEVTQAREKLHEAIEELKTLDEMKTNLLSNVSHELRTPLVAVMGYNDMILNGKAGVINEVQAEFLEISIRNIEKLVTLIENLLDFSRLHRGAEELVFDTFDLSDCARTSMQIVQPVADSRGIKLELIAPDEPALVEGDKGKLGQVFNNLLSNAVKFNHPDGWVRVEIKPGDEDYEISVSDNGIGIPEEAQDKVFTRFYQYDGSSTRKYGGTGIGLAISQDIMRLHGSRITVQSTVEKDGEPGHTVFRFALPRSVSEQRDREAGGHMPPLPTETHLLVEVITQDRALSAQIRNVLISEGMDVIHAAYPAVAISLAERYNPDCILLDTEAGPLGGRLVEEVLEAASLGADTLMEPVDAPIVLLTNDDALYERYRKQVAGRVVRSFRKSTLLSGIHYALSKGVPAGEQLGKKVLCVDDDPEITRFIGRLLETDGFETETCAKGEEALERVVSGDYWLVLLDIAMPGLDGFETCQAIKGNADLAGIRVYMVTAKPIDQNLGRLHACGADGYLLKPFKAEDLLGLVQTIAPRADQPAGGGVGGE